MKDKWETSEGNHVANRTQGDKSDTNGRQMKDTWETSEGNDPTNQTQSGRQMKDKSKTNGRQVREIMRPTRPRVGDT